MLAPTHVLSPMFSHEFFIQGRKLMRSRNYYVRIIEFTQSWRLHYTDVMMSAMASQITSLTIVYLTVYLGANQRKHQSSASLVTDDFPVQRASNAENVSS